MNNISKTPNAKPETGILEFLPLGLYLTTFITRLLNVWSKKKIGRPCIFISSTIFIAGENVA